MEESSKRFSCHLGIFICDLVKPNRNHSNRFKIFSTSITVEKLLMSATVHQQTQSVSYDDENVNERAIESKGKLAKFNLLPWD